jgi:signal transduction histidine kinase
MLAALFAPPRPLIVAFAALVIGFVLATSSAEWSQVRIRKAANSISTNSAASVHQLSNTRSVLRRFEVMVDDYVDRPSRAAREQIEQVRRDLAQSWDAYRQLPTYPGERDLWGEVERSFVHVDECLALIFAGSDPLATLEKTFKPHVDLLDGALARIERLNNENGLMLVQQIDRDSRRSIITAFTLDGVCVVLAVLMAVLLVRAENRYREAMVRRSEELETFAARVAHDILSPLNVIGMFIEVLSHHGALDDRLERLKALARTSLDRSSAIVNDLLEFARAGARPTVGAHADVQAVVKEVSEELQESAAQKQIALSVEPVAQLQVACSRGVLTSVVSNLVRNAIKYMNESNERFVKIRAHPAGPMVRLEVEDSGPGIPASLEPDLFQPYVRGAGAPGQGIGLGLATVKRFVDSHGGRVGVVTSRARGSLFWVELPVARL